MTIQYKAKTDLLYLRIATGQQEVTNKRLTEDIVDMGSDNKIVGIEIMDASRHVDLEKLMPAKYLKAL